VPDGKRCIAFHSYKGGTGKTTIAANLSALLAAKGFNVALLDLDVYAPSLHTYFDKKPNKWINDLLLDNAELDEVMVDMTPELEGLFATRSSTKGKMWVGFANPDKEAIYKLEGNAAKQSTPRMNSLRKFIQLREDLISKYGCDYLILDTSPGIRFWSINSLAISDVLLLTLKFGELDIAGTVKIAREIYGSFTEFGSKSFALLNRVAGYCVPHSDTAQLVVNGSTLDQSEFDNTLSNEIGVSLVSSIPCYCDIQFIRKEYLTVLQYPEHPFAKKLESLADSDQLRV
jgi:MinD-like ATPase involved in chromosome partitioning or flagellar assembly